MTEPRGVSTNSLKRGKRRPRGKEQKTPNPNSRSTPSIPPASLLRTRMERSGLPSYFTRNWRKDWVLSVLWNLWRPPSTRPPDYTRKGRTSKRFARPSKSFSRREISGTTSQLQSWMPRRTLRSTSVRRVAPNPRRQILPPEIQLWMRIEPPHPPCVNGV